MQTLEKFNQFVKEITAENGRLYKISILEKYKDDEDIKYYLNFLHNPYITTGISDKSLKRFHSDSCIDTYPNNKFSTTFEALNYLKEHNTGDYNTLDLMFSYYTSLYIKDVEPMTIHLEETYTHQLFEKIIGKNIQLGIDSKTINKVIPNLIPEFNVMLANKYFDTPKVVEGKEFAITTKIDGMRCIMLKENGIVTFWSRQGQKIEGLVDLEEEAKKYFADNLCLDGELVASLDTPDTYKETMKRARTKDTEKHGLKMLVFDGMYACDFRKQTNDKYMNKYWKRRSFILDKMCHNNGQWLAEKDPKDYIKDAALPMWEFSNFCADRINSNLQYFQVLPILYQGTDTSKIEEILKEQVANGEEGIMINIVDAPYEFKRTNNLLKVKLFNDADLECIGFEEGTNSNKGRLGAILLKYNDNIVKCGSGFSEELREEIWQHQEDWLGRTITVKYFEESYGSKTGKKSLRFPIYVDWREDK